MSDAAAAAQAATVITEQPAPKMLKKGYTLIEILVVISIIALLMQGGLASYRAFARRQLIVNVRRQVEGDLRLAQQQSLANVHPSGFTCSSPNTFSGVSFSVPDRTSYVVSAVCSDGNYYPIKVAAIPPNAAFVRPSDREIIFLPLAKGTDVSGRWQLGICTYGTDSTSLVVSQTGEIVEEAFDDCSEAGDGGSPPFWCSIPILSELMCWLLSLVGISCPCD